jgi:hypothetical protein
MVTRRPPIADKYTTLPVDSIKLDTYPRMIRLLSFFFAKFGYVKRGKCRKERLTLTPSFLLFAQPCVIFTTVHYLTIWYSAKTLKDKPILLLGREQNHTTYRLDMAASPTNCPWWYIRMVAPQFRRSLHIYDLYRLWKSGMISWGSWIS